LTIFLYLRYYKLQTATNLSIRDTSYEKVLLQQIASGHEPAFRELYNIYHKKLYNYIYNITKISEITEEIVADIFVKLWVGRELLVQIEQPNAFLHKVAYYKSIDFLKTLARHTRLQQRYNEWYLATAGEKSPDQALIDAEMVHLISKAINQLTPQRKLIYRLSREEGMTHEQIARHLNLSRHTVRNSIMAATRFIDTYLKEQLLGPAMLLLLIS
jgi:RNA polymerase sigma factor, sigma-70 family